MNRIHKIMWNSVKRQWVVVSELVKRGKTKSVKLAAVTALSSISTIAMAVCVKPDESHGYVANLGSTCASFLPEDATNTDLSSKEQIFNHDVIVVNTGATVNHHGNLKITNTGTNNALIIGSPDDLTTDLATVNIDGNLTIENDADLNADDTKKNALPSGILLGDNSNLTIKGDLVIMHRDNHDANWGAGAPIRVWNAKANNSSITVEGTTSIVSNGDGIRNGEETADLLAHKGGNLKFNDQVTIDAQYVGLKNNAGTILFDKGVKISAGDGIGLVQTQNGGSIISNGDLTLTAYGWHNNMIIKGGELTVKGDANIITTGSGKDADKPDFDESIASSAAIYVEQAGDDSVSPKIRFDGSTLNATTKSITGLNKYGIGDVIKMRGGYLSLAMENHLTAEGSGNGITLSDGTITALGQQPKELFITTDEGKAIYMTGGNLYLNKTDITKNSFDANDNSTRNTIELAGGKLVVTNDIKVSKSQDSTLIHSTVASGNTAEFNTTSQGTIDLNINNPSGEIEDVVHHDGTGTLKVNNDGNLTARHYLFKNTSTGTIIALNTSDLTGMIDSGNGEINLTQNSNWALTGDSKLTNLYNNGTISFIHDQNKLFLGDNSKENPSFYTLNITGNYESNGGVIKMYTLWNENGSDSDKLIIDGTASGNTIIVPVTDGREYIIDGNVQQVASALDSIAVVKVRQSGDNAFQGTARTTGAIEVQLKKRTYNGEDQYYWTMTAQENGGSDNGGNGNGGNGNGGSDNGGNGNGGNGNGGNGNGGSDNGGNGNGGNGNGGSDNGGNGNGGNGNGNGNGGHNSGKGNSGKNKGTLIYADAVAGYTLMPRVNLEQGFASIGSLQVRRTDIANVDGKRQTWARTFGHHQKQNGKDRLNLDTNIYGIQIGHDFMINQTDNKGLNVLGGYISYSRANTDFSDKYHAKKGIVISDKHTGKGKSDNISLGLTNTYFTDKGTYLDIVGQLSYLHNKYTARTGNNPDTQDGWGAAVSAEVGHSIQVSSTWSIQPQAQMVYQYLNLDSFSDGLRYVDQNNQDSLRGRIGLKAAYNVSGKTGKGTSIYTVGNVWHDFIKPDNVNIGRDSIRENFSSTWGEIGVGVHIPVAKQSQIYGDVRYEHNFGGAKRQSFRGNIGLKVNW
ncbi:autotransporter outer membrane beta-barrel domain-containing protein [Snodgrassella communis]|uniref:autotransporter outer membrane beta-barrel domain-containing protein n=1 Tax=Snodgrassella communis TaxID=2946699 RepID=UPI001EF5A2CA|nr:autotransporter outer membrane beta-barrel domain-containing protein [Snodgrassella communis]